MQHPLQPYKIDIESDTWKPYVMYISPKLWLICAFTVKRHSNDDLDLCYEIKKLKKSEFLWIG